MSAIMEADTGEMIVKRVSVPLGLEELMEGLTKEVLLKKPDDIYLFAAEYFSKLLSLREKENYKVKSVTSVRSVARQTSKQPIERLLIRGAPKQLSRQISIRGDSPPKKNVPPRRPVGRRDQKEDKGTDTSKFMDRRNKIKKIEPTETKVVGPKPIATVRANMANTDDKSNTINKRDRSVSTTRRGRSVTKSAQITPRQKSTSTPRTSRNDSAQNKSSKDHNKDDGHLKKGIIENSVKDRVSTEVSDIKESDEIVYDKKSNTDFKKNKVSKNAQEVNEQKNNTKGDKDKGDVISKMSSIKKSHEVPQDNKKPESGSKPTKIGKDTEARINEKKESITESELKENIIPKVSSVEETNEFIKDGQLTVTPPKVMKRPLIPENHELITSLVVPQIIHKIPSTDVNNELNLSESKDDGITDISRNMEYYESTTTEAETGNVEKVGKDDVIESVSSNIEESKKTDVTESRAIEKEVKDDSEVDTKENSSEVRSKSVDNTNEDTEQNRVDTNYLKVEKADGLNEDNLADNAVNSKNLTTTADAVVKDVYNITADNSGVENNIQQGDDMKQAAKEAIIEIKLDPDNKTEKDVLITDKQISDKNEDNALIYNTDSKKSDEESILAVTRIHDKGSGRGESEKMMMTVREGLDNVKSPKKCDSWQGEIRNGKILEREHKDNEISEKLKDSLHIQASVEKNIEPENIKNIKKYVSAEQKVRIIETENKKDINDDLKTTKIVKENETSKDLERNLQISDDSSLNKDKVSENINNGVNSYIDIESKIKSVDNDKENIEHRDVNTTQIEKESEPTHPMQETKVNIGKDELVVQAEGANVTKKEDSQENIINDDEGDTMLQDIVEPHKENNIAVQMLHEDKDNVEFQEQNTFEGQVTGNDIFKSKKMKNDSKENTDLLKTENLGSKLEGEIKPKLLKSGKDIVNKNLIGDEKSVQDSTDNKLLPVDDGFSKNLLQGHDNDGVEKSDTEGEKKLKSDNQTADRHKRASNFRSKNESDVDCEKEDKKTDDSNTKLVDKKGIDDDTDLGKSDSGNEITSEQQSDFILKAVSTTVDTTEEDAPKVNEINQAIEGSLQEAFNKQNIINKDKKESNFIKDDDFNHDGTEKKVHDEERDNGDVLQGITTLNHISKDDLIKTTDTVEPDVINHDVIHSNDITERETQTGKEKIGETPTTNEESKHNEIAHHIVEDESIEKQRDDKNDDEQGNHNKNTEPTSDVKTEQKPMTDEVCTGNNNSTEDALKGIHESNANIFIAEENNENKMHNNKDTKIHDSECKSDKSGHKNDTDQVNEDELRSTMETQLINESRKQYSDVGDKNKEECSKTESLGVVNNATEYTVNTSSTTLKSSNYNNKGHEGAPKVEEISADEVKGMPNSEDNESKSQNQETNIVSNVINAVLMTGKENPIDTVVKTYINDFIRNEQQNTFAKNDDQLDESMSQRQEENTEKCINTVHSQINTSIPSTGDAISEKENGKIEIDSSVKNVDTTENISGHEETINSNITDSTIINEKQGDNVVTKEKYETYVKENLNQSNPINQDQPKSNSSDEEPSEADTKKNNVMKYVTADSFDETVKNHINSFLHGEKENVFVQNKEKENVTSLTDIDQKEIKPKNNDDIKDLKKPADPVGDQNKNTSDILDRSDLGKITKLENTYNPEVDGKRTKSKVLPYTSTKMPENNYKNNRKDGRKMRRVKTVDVINDNKVKPEVKSRIPTADYRYRVKRDTNNGKHAVLVKPLPTFKKTKSDSSDEKNEDDVTCNSSIENRNENVCNDSNDTESKSKIVCEPDFDVSQLHEELKAVEDESKLTSFKSSFNPYVLHQEIKNASLKEKYSSKDEPVSKFRNALTDVAAAIRIQSIWRGYIVRKSKDAKMPSLKAVSDTNLHADLPWQDGTHVDETVHGFEKYKKDKAEVDLDHNSMKNDYTNESVNKSVSKIDSMKNVEELTSMDGDFNKLTIAATKVQAIWRGFQVRKFVKQNGWKGKTHNGNHSTDRKDGPYITTEIPSETDSKLESSENFAKAALIIQKLWRGFKVRRNINKNKDIMEQSPQQRLHIDDAEKRQEESDNKSMNKKDGEYLEVDNQKAVDHFLMDEIKFKRAAITIQKIWRGFKVRSILRRTKEEGENSFSKNVNTLEDNEQSEDKLNDFKTEEGKRKTALVNGNLQTSSSTTAIDARNNKPVIDLGENMGDLTDSKEVKKALETEDAELPDTITKEMKSEENKLTSVPIANDATSSSLKNNKTDLNKTFESEPKRSSGEDNNNDKFLKAAIRIQKIWRGFQVRKNLNKNGPFGTKVEIEHPVMETVEPKEKIDQKDRKSALKIQSLWRGYQVRKNIGIIKNKLEDKSAASTNIQREITDGDILNAATKIQAGIRGYLQRKRYKRGVSTLNSITEEDEQCNVKEMVMNEETDAKKEKIEPEALVTKEVNDIKQGQNTSKKLSEDDIFQALEQLNKLEISNELPLIKENNKHTFHRSNTVQEPEIIKKMCPPLLKSVSLDNNNNNSNHFNKPSIKKNDDPINMKINIATEATDNKGIEDPTKIETVRGNEHNEHPLDTAEFEKDGQISSDISTKNNDLQVVDNEMNKTEVESFTEPPATYFTNSVSKENQEESKSKYVSKHSILENPTTIDNATSDLHIISNASDRKGSIPEECSQTSNTQTMDKVTCEEENKSAVNITGGNNISKQMDNDNEFRHILTHEIKDDQHNDQHKTAYYKSTSIDSTDSAVTVVERLEEYTKDVENSNENDLENESSENLETFLEHENLINDFQNKLLDQISGKNGEKVSSTEDATTKFDIDKLRKELKEAGLIYNNDDNMSIKHQNSKEEVNGQDQLLHYLSSFDPDGGRDDEGIHMDESSGTAFRDLPDIKEEEPYTKYQVEENSSYIDNLENFTKNINESNRTDKHIYESEINIQKIQSTLKECENIAQEINRGFKDIENDHERNNSYDQTNEETSPGNTFCKTSVGTGFSSKCIDNKPLLEHVELIHSPDTDKMTEKHINKEDKKVLNYVDPKDLKTQNVPADLSSNEDALKTSCLSNKLLHTGELHDTVVVPLPFDTESESQSSDAPEDRCEQSSSNDSTQTAESNNSKLLHTGELHDTVVVSLPLLKHSDSDDQKSGEHILENFSIDKEENNTRSSNSITENKMSKTKKVENNRRNNVDTGLLDAGDLSRWNDLSTLETQNDLNDQNIKELLTEKGVDVADPLIDKNHTEQCDLTPGNIPSESKDDKKINDITRLLHTGELHDTVIVSVPIQDVYSIKNGEEHSNLDSSQTVDQTEENLKKLNEQQLHSDNSGLLHTGELHDTVVVSLPRSSEFSNEMTTGEKEGNKDEDTPRQVDSESQTTGEAIAVHLNQAQAGVAVLTSPRPASDVGDVTGVDNDIAQAPDKGVLPIEPNSDYSAPPDLQSMESERRKNATINNKSMEVEAATKIQAGFRGYQVRKQLKLKNGPSDKNSQRRQARRKSSGRITDTGRIIQNKPKDQNDIEEKSAVKIQAGVRGFLVRRRQKKQKNQES